MSVVLKQKPNGIYYIDTQLPDAAGNLKRARISFDTRDKAEAEEQRRQWIVGTHPKHPAQGGVVAPKGRAVAPISSTSTTKRQDGMTVIRWLDHCLSTIWSAEREMVKNDRTHRSNVRVLSSFLPLDLLLEDLTDDHLTDLEEMLRAKGYKPGSVRKLLGALSAALTHALDTKNRETGKPYLAVKPRFPKIKVKNKRERVISLDEEVAIFECIEARIHAEPLRPWREFKWLLMVLRDTAFRLGEALQLGPASVNRNRWLDERTGAVTEAVYLGIARYTAKNDKPREVPCTDRLLALIPDLNAQAKGGRWFPWPVGSSGPLYLWDNIRDDMAKRGFDLSEAVLHTWRHTCATRLARGGMDLLSLKDWMGHSDIKITAERYVHLMVAHIHRGASILNTYSGTMSPTQGGTNGEESDPSTMAYNQPSGSDRDTAGTWGHA